MKYIKTFENKYKRKRIKKYIVVLYDDDLYLSKVEEFNEIADEIFVEDLYFFKSETNQIKKENSSSSLKLEYLDGLLLTTDDYDKAYKYFMEKAELLKHTNKYNL